MAPEIRVLIVDEADGRATIRKAVGSSDITIIGEAGFGTEAFTAARELRPDVAIVGLEEPIARPQRTIEALSAGQAAPAVIVVSSLGDRDHVRKAMLAGARDYLRKPIRNGELQHAIVAAHEAEQHRRQFGDGGRRQGEVIVVFGAKGGIGKTTLAVNLAAAIARQTGQRVALVDTDTQLGDVAVMLDLLPERTIVDAAEMVDRLEPELIQTLLREDATGVHVLAGPMSPEEGEAIGGHHIKKIIEVMANTYDYVVVDTAPHYSDAVLTTLDAATMVLLVSTPDVPALKNTKLTLAMMRSWHHSEDKVKLILNYAYSSNGVVASDAANTLDYAVFWKIPFDSAVPAAVKVGRPVVEVKPGSKMAQNIHTLAQTICGIRPTRRGLIDRLFRR
ncbi:MAG: P-loop NTPase [Chloroflexota bacterium]